MEPLPTIGLTCPVCNRIIPASRLKSPRCDCGWRRRSNRWRWLFWGGLFSVAAFFSVAALRQLGSRSHPGADRAPKSQGVSFVGVSQTKLEDGRPAPGSLHAATLKGSSTQEKPLGRAQDNPPKKPVQDVGKLLVQARDLAAKGKLLEAADAYRKAIALDPASVEAHLELGLLCGDQGDFQCARSELSVAQRMRPNDPYTREQLASVLREGGFPGQALKIYRDLQRDFPRRRAAFIGAARILDELERLEHAIAAYEEFLRLFPDSPEAEEAARRLEELAPSGDDADQRGENEFRVPILQSGSAILVDGEVERANDVRFLLDTGSTLTIISRELADEIGFDLDSPELSMITLQTASGVVEAPVVVLEVVRFGKAVAYDVRAAIYDVESTDSVDGLLGLSFLRRFRVTIDHDDRAMILKPRKEE